MCESDRATGKRVREMVEDMDPSLLGIIQVFAKHGQDQLHDWIQEEILG